MPLKLCRCDKEKLNRVVDQVKTLSSTLDQLREEVNSLKVRFLEETSDEDTQNYCESKDRIWASPFHKLKTYFERNVIPASTGTGSCVKKKCQSFFAQTPRPNVACSRQVAPPKLSICRDADSFCSSQNRTYDSNKISNWIAKRKPVSKKSQRDVCQNCRKTKSASTSMWSLKKNREDKSKKKSVDKRSKKVKRGKERKILRRASSSSTSLSSDSNAKEFLYPAARSRRLRGCNRTKRYIVETTDASSCVSTSTSAVDRPSCRIICRKVGRNRNERKKSWFRITKTSKSTQCPDCANSKMFHRDTLAARFQDGHGNATWKGTCRRKKLATRNTQTCSLYDENFEVCINEREMYRPVASVTLCNESLTSLTSSSSITTEGPSLELLAENLSTNLVLDVTEDTKNTSEEKNLVSTNKSEENVPAENESDPAAIDFTTRRRKRTYVISEDVPLSKDNATGDFYGKNDNFSSDIMKRSLNDRNVTYTSCGNISAKQEMIARTFQNYEISTTPCQSTSIQREEKLVKTVCNDHSRNKYFPKFPRWSKK